MNRYDLSNIEIKIYYQSNDEFEEVRNLCLKEKNWLGKNYTKNNLIIEEHQGYGVVFQKSSGKPMVMAGVFNDQRYPKNVAKMINRLYTFPEFRMKPTDMIDGFKVTCRLIDELLKINNFEVYLITMQNRSRGGKRWWDIWCNYMNLASNNMWKLGQGYIQTCPWPVQKCWQNFVYHETILGAFDHWNPKTITDEEWNSLEVGT